MDDADALRQQLRDEAAWRSFVEDELAREAQKARIWRQRAEERARRIDRLVAGQSLRQAVATRLAGSEVPRLRVPDEDAATATATAGLSPQQARTRAPALPEVRALTMLATDRTRSLADELDRRELTTLGEQALHDIDLALIEGTAWNEEVAAVLRPWLEGDARTPIAWFGDVPPEVLPLLGPRDTVVGAAPGNARTLELAPWATSPPPDQLPRDAVPGRWVESPAGAALTTTKGIGLVVAPPDQPHRTLGLALAGIPVVDGDGRGPHGLPNPEQRLDLDALGRGEGLPPAVRRLAIRQRRHVERTALPHQRLLQVLGHLEVPVPAHEPRLAVLLSSNRPDLVPEQLAALAAQHRRPDEVRIALHGGATPLQRRAVEAAADEHGLQIWCTTPSAELPLGTVLNQLADGTSAELLAKIDDDDHYGPAHLLDAEAALRRTGADLVGNKAHYVHLTGEDRTWLLAEDAEDVWVEQGLMGATFVWRHALMETVRFSPRPRRVDSLYVRAAAAAGALLYARPANDFVYIRDPGGRTNVAGATYVRARGRDVGAGLPLDVVDI